MYWRWHRHVSVRCLRIWRPLVGRRRSMRRRVSIVVLAHLRWTHWPAPISPALVWHWGRLSSGVLLELLATTEGAQAAAEYAKKKRTTNSGCDTDDDCLVALNPRFNFVTNRAAFAYTLSFVSNYCLKRRECDIRSGMYLHRYNLSRPRSFAEARNTLIQTRDWHS